MTIRKGQEWAEPVSMALAQIATKFADDATLAIAALDAWEAGEPLVASPGPGDALKTLGLDTARRDENAMMYPWDLGVAELYLRGSTRRIPFISQVVVRPRNRPGRLISIMNTPWYGRYRLGPRAHPNDGLVDITDGTLPLGQLVQARRRAVTGAHLPHPALATSRVSEWDMSFDCNMTAIVDGVSVKSVNRLAISLIPDAFSIVA